MSLATAKTPSESRRFLPLLGELAALALLSLVAFLWIPSGYIANGNDTSYPNQPTAWLNERFYMWNSVENGGGNYGSAIAGMLWHAAQAFFYAVAGSHTNGERAFLAFWLFVAGVSIWSFLRFVVGGRIGTYVGTALYLLNPFVASGAVWENASASNVAFYATLPALMTIYFLTAERRLSISRGFALFALVSVVGSPLGMLPPLQIAYLFMGAVVVAGWSILRWDALHWRPCVTAALFVLAYVAANAFWMLPLGSYIWGLVHTSGSSGLAANNFQSWLGPISKHTSLLNVSRLLGAWDWFEVFNGASFIGVSPTYLRNPIFIVLGIGVAGAAYAAVVLRTSARRRRIAVLFALLAVVMSVLSAGAHSPTGLLYGLLYKYLPGMVVVRSPWYMFEGITLFSYSVLIAITTSSLTKQVAPRWRPFIPVVLIGSIAFYGYPLLDGSFFEPFRPTLPPFVVAYPKYAEQAAEYLSKRQGRYATVPFMGGSLFYWPQGAYGGGAPVTTFMTRRSVAYGYQNTYGTSTKPFDILLRQTMSDVLSANSASLSDLQLLRIGDIVIQHDYWYDWGGPAGSPETWEAAVRRIPGVNLAAKFGPWRVYHVAVPPSVRLFSDVAVAEDDVDLGLGLWSRATGNDEPIVNAQSITPLIQNGEASSLIRDLVYTRADESQLDQLRHYIAGTNVAILSTIHNGNDASVTLPDATAGRNHLYFAASRLTYRISRVPLLSFDSWRAMLFQTFSRRFSLRMRSGHVLISGSNYSVSGETKIPVLRSTPLNLLPVMHLDVQSNEAADNLLTLLVVVKLQNQSTATFRVPASNGLTSILDVVNSELQRRAAAGRKAHSSDQQWLLAHREDPRGQGGSAEVFLCIHPQLQASNRRTNLEIEVRDVSAWLRARGQGAILVKKIALEPDVARWSGLTEQGRNPIKASNFTTLAAQPASNFTDFEPPAMGMFRDHERYNITVGGGKEFNAEIIRRSGRKLFFRVDNGPLTAVDVSKITLVKPPDVGGIVNVRSAVIAKVPDHSVLAFSVADTGAILQEIRLMFRDHGGNKRAVIYGGKTDYTQGIEVFSGPDMQFTESSRSLTLLNSGASPDWEGPGSEHFAISFDQLQARAGIKQNAVLIGLDLEFSQASIGLTLSDPEILIPASGDRTEVALPFTIGTFPGHARLSASGMYESPLAVSPGDRLGLRTTNDGTVLLKRDRPRARKIAQLSFEQVNPTRYYVSIPAGGPRVLTLDQSFDNGWEAISLRPGTPKLLQYFTIFSPWWQKGTKLDHLRMSTYENGWFVPASGPSTVLLFYRPQQLLEIAEAISAISLLFCVGIVWWRSHA